MQIDRTIKRIDTHTHPGKRSDLLNGLNSVLECTRIVFCLHFLNLSIHTHIHINTSILWQPINGTTSVRIYCCCRNSLRLHCFPEIDILCVPPFPCPISMFTMYAKCTRNGNYTEYFSFRWIPSPIFFLSSSDLFFVHRMRTNSWCGCVEYQKKKKHFDNMKWAKENSSRIVNNSIKLCILHFAWIPSWNSTHFWSPNNVYDYTTQAKYL